MKQWTEELVEDCVQQVLSCREFCGSERETFLDFCLENAVPSKSPIEDTSELDGRGEVFLRANREWDKSRKEAGVR